MQALHPHAHAQHDHDHGAETLQAWLKTVLLFGLGLYFAYNIVSGNLTNYINARFAWLSYLAAALFLLLAASSAYRLLRVGGHHDDHANHSHPHESISWTMLGIVALPLILGTLVPSRPLGASAIDGGASLNAVGSTASITTVAIPPLERNVLDWLRVFNSVADYAELNGEPADVIGFVYREPAMDADMFMLARFTISCCVADASAIGLPVAWADAETLPTDAWVRVQGTFAVGQFRDDRVPVLQATTVEQVEQPKHPYLYP